MAAAAEQTLKARQWLEQLYAGCEGWVTLFALDRTANDGRRVTEWAEVGDWDTLLGHAYRLAPSSDVWFGVATRKQHLSNGQRGGEDECLQLPGLWVDLDVFGPTHARDDLPPDIDAAHELLADFPLNPTAVVHTGGGLQAWWFFNEPLDATEAAPLLARFGATWAELGRRHGWHVDNVFDLPRIMRLPGTWNRKSEAVQVFVTEWDFDRRYGYDDIDQYTIEAPQPAYEVVRHQVPYIGPERPGDAFTAATDPAEVLEAAGWTYHHRDQDGGRHYTRPGKERRDGSSATVYADGHAIVWSDATDLAVRRSYDAFGLYTHLRHGGDFAAATSELRNRGFGASNAVDDSWKVQWPVELEAPEPAVDPFAANLHTVAELRLIKPPPPLIDGIFDHESLAVLYGPPKSMKTFLALSWALSVSTGAWWQGHVVHKAPVVYVAAEGQAHIVERIDAWMTHHNILGEDDFRVLTVPVNLFDPAKAGRFRDLIAPSRPGLVVFDTLARCTVGVDENSGKDMGIVIEQADFIRQATGACVLLVHHDNRAGTNIRGHSSLDGALDTGISVVKDDNLIRVELKYQKNHADGKVWRLGPVEAGQSVALDRYRGGAGEEISAAGLAMLETLQATGPVSSSVWFKSCEKVAERTFHRTKSGLLEQNLVAVTQPGRGGIYAITVNALPYLDDIENGM